MWTEHGKHFRRWKLRKITIVTNLEIYYKAICIFTCDLTAFNSPTEGVRPPSLNAEHNSIRFAPKNIEIRRKSLELIFGNHSESPPSTAALADSKESTQTSSIFSVKYVYLRQFSIKY